MSKILVTGAAGFIGCETALKLLELGNSVVGIDNLNDYYDVSLKEARLQRISGDSNFKFVKMDIADRGSINTLFESESFDYVINLAAQAGVRYSLENPQAYMDSNMTGFFNILEACRHYPVKHLVYASSSSVYAPIISVRGFEGILHGQTTGKRLDRSKHTDQKYVVGRGSRTYLHLRTIQICNQLNWYGQGSKVISDDSIRQVQLSWWSTKG